MTSKPTLLFDLGGVIVPWVGIEALIELTGLTRSAVLKEFEQNTLFAAHEIGQCEDDVFLRELINAFDLKVDVTEAKRLWQSWVKPPFPGTSGVLQDLQQRFNTACLSNTNALHWTRLQDILPLETSFHKAYASHLLGAAKPDARCYQLAIDDMGVAPENVTFFDDTQANIDAALALGMDAHLVDRSVGVLPLLKKLDLI